tara:strand:+ start:81 stop:239 length:159 start_codon:yes stop_codon:yes gene_type:complete
MKIRIVDCKGSKTNISELIECDYYVIEKGRLQIFNKGIEKFNLPSRFFGIEL